MAFEASETIVVRGNEIGFRGHVPPGTFARYGESARWGMFRKSAGDERLKIGSGVARGQHLELLEEVTYPSTLRIDTVFGRLGRTSLDVAHRVTRVEDGVLVARMRVTIVKIGPNGPAEFDRALESLVTPTDEPAALSFDEGPPEYETLLVPRPSDQDRFRHVNQARYVDFADDVRWFAASGGNPAGFDGPIRRVSVDYRREVKAGMQIRAEMRTGRDGARSVRFVDGATGTEMTRVVVAG